MTSKFNRDWFESGRKARLHAEARARDTGQPVYLPESSYNATAHNYWRRGWNSITREELTNIWRGSAANDRPHRSGLDHLQHLKHQLGAPHGTSS